MNTIIKTGLAAILLLAISCKKENNTIQSSRNTDKSSTPDLIAAGKYTFVWIHGQRWMTTNLDVTRYRNGDSIPQIRYATNWSKKTTGAWCWYNNDSATYAATYGRLYNWYAVNDPRGLAPTGWHIASADEWDTLATHLGNNAGGKLKDTGTIEAGNGLWYAPNFRATNKTGFTGLPGGFRNAYDGTFSFIGSLGFWWTSTGYSSSTAFYYSLDYSNSLIYWYVDIKRYGYSVRCLRD